MYVFLFLLEGRLEKIDIYVGWIIVFFIIFFQGCVNFFVICYIIELKDLDYLDFLQNIILIYYMDDIILIRLDK